MKARLKIFLCAAFVLLCLGWLFCLPRELFRDIPYATVLLDRNGELLSARIARDGQWRFPPTDEVPEKYRKAVVTFEDRWFYMHPGVNPLAVCRALAQNIRSGKVESGGSTITMQLIRMSRGRERTLRQKAIEAVLALRLEMRMTKDEILALYASYAPFGGNVVGIDAALWRFWGRSGHDISWAEAATLAVLPNAPSTMHLEKNRNALLSKRNRLLKRLYEAGEMDWESYVLSVEEHLPDKLFALPAHAPHLVDHIARETPGCRHGSAIELSMQIQLEQLMDLRQREYRLRGTEDMAAVVVDVKSGEVLAYCGNGDYDPGRPGSQVDILRSPRSTGSILKPFLYCHLLETGKLLPAAIVPDIPMASDGFSPRNFDLEYRGAVPADKALAASLNLPAVHELQMAGVDEFALYLRSLGMTTLTRKNSEYGLSLILGGAEGKLLEITKMYAGLARRSSRPAEYWTLMALTSLARPDRLNADMTESGRQIAWKTGTSYGFRDAWAVGVTPEYAVGVWVGNASGQGAPQLTGATAAGPILFDIFNLLPPTGNFPALEEGPGAAKVAVCRESGHMAGEHCSHVDSLIVPTAGAGSTPCPYHRPVCLSEDNMYRVLPTTPGAHMESMFILPADMAHHYAKRHPEYRPLPPVAPYLDSGGDDGSITFLTPRENSSVRLARQMDGSTRGLLVKASHAIPGTALTWFVDGSFLTVTETIHSVEIPSLFPGPHTITLCDPSGHSATLHCKVL